MKPRKLAVLFACSLLLLFGSTLPASAQTSDSFDIASFNPPAGWQKQTKNGALVFGVSSEPNHAFAMVVLYKSGASSGDAKRDSENDWKQFVAGELGIKSKPQRELAKTSDGWQMITASAAYENDLGPAAVVLSTYSGYGRSFSVAALFNSKDYLKEIELFGVSIKLKKPEALVQTSEAGKSDSSILGTWGSSSSDQTTNGVRGYIKREYTFSPDGTYRFISKTFTPNSAKLLFGNETGSYRVSGDTLTITPKSSVLEGWSKSNDTDKWGSRIDSQNRKLETVTYKFTKHYFSGIQTWSLVLSADRTTERDGPYSGGLAFNSAWIYSPPCAQCFIELPR